MRAHLIVVLSVLFLSACNSAAPMRSDEVSRLEEKALNAYRYGDLLAAESYLHRLLAQQDNDAQGWLLLGNIQLRQQRFKMQHNMPMSKLFCGMIRYYWRIIIWH